MKLLASLAVSAAAVTPTQKVVELLHGMQDKAAAEKETEAKEHDKYVEFCQDTAAEKSHAIEKEETSIEQLKAEIEAQMTASENLGEEIKELDSSIAKAEADMQAATELRTQEKNDYELQDQDYAESIDSMERAIAAARPFRRAADHDPEEKGPRDEPGGDAAAAGRAAVVHVGASVEKDLAASGIQEPKHRLPAGRRCAGGRSLLVTHGRYYRHD
mmetsp:Transcript_68198/g.181503  ORF Transcript_68198/g.181503 Transcript_68198/m.181503 type:complete len:216 (+) Transcript_68198:80-727(+)